MRKARHLLDEKNQYFLEASLKRTVKIAASTPLWRAVHDLSWRTEPILDDDLNEIDSIDVKAPALPDRMKPFRDRAAEGTCEPEGHSVFVLVYEYGDSNDGSSPVGWLLCVGGSIRPSA